MKKSISLLILLSFLFSSCIANSPRTRDDEQDDKTTEDTVNLVLVSYTPTGSNVSKSTEVVLTFNKALRNDDLYPIYIETSGSSVNWNIAVRDSSGDAVVAQDIGSGSSLSDDKKTLTIAFADTLEDGETYTVYINTYLRAQDLSTLEEVKSFSFKTKTDDFQVENVYFTSEPGQTPSVRFNRSVDVKTIYTNINSSSCSEQIDEDTVKRGIHISCDGVDGCIPLKSYELNDDNKVIVLTPKDPLPFNSTCQLIVYKENLADLSTEPQKLKADFESDEFEIDGFTISGTINYKYIPIVDAKLDSESAVKKSAPPVIVQLRNGSEETIKTVTGCTVTSSGCTFEFNDLEEEEGYYVRVKMSINYGSASISVVDPDQVNLPGLTKAPYVFDQLVDEDTLNQDEEVTIYIDDTNQNAAPMAILDTLWQAYEAVFDGSGGFNTTVFWSPKTMAVADEQVDLAEGLFPNTFSRWDTIYGTFGELFLVGNRAIDSDEYDRHVITREWLRLYLDRYFRVDAPIRNGSFGMPLDPRAAFYEGLLTGMATAILEDPVYGDSLGSATSTNSSGWEYDYSADSSEVLWASMEEVARFAYVYRSLFSDYLQTIDQMAASAEFNTIYKFLYYLGDEITAQDISDITENEASFKLGFTKAFDGGMGANETDEDFLYTSRQPLYSLTIGESLDVLFKSYSDLELLGSGYNTAFIDFYGNGNLVNISISGEHSYLAQIYKMTSSGPYYENGNEATGAQQFDFESQSGQRYMMVLSGIQAGDDSGVNEEDEEEEESTVIEGKIDSIIETISVALTDSGEYQASDDVIETFTTESHEFSVGKATLPGEVTFSRKEGSKKLTIALDPLWANLSQFSATVVAVSNDDEAPIEITSDSTTWSEYFETTQVSFSGADGAITVTVSGYLNGQFRVKTVSYPL